MGSLRKFFILISLTFISTCKIYAQYDLNEIYKQLGIAINQAYTAEMHILNVEGNDSGMVFQVSYKNGNIRIEGEQNKVKLITIIKIEGDMYTYNSEVNEWNKIKIKDLMSSDAPVFSKVGTETVDGKECTKFETFDKQTGYQSLIWIYDGLIYKKVSLGPNDTSEIIVYKNIVKKSLDDSLFIPTSPYKK